MSSKPRPNRRRNLLVRWGGLSVAGTAVLAVVISLASRRERLVIAPAGTGTAGVTSILQRTAEDRDVPIQFEDVTGRVGVNFRHFPAVRASYIAEDMGSGLAWGDYDGDGYPDLFLVNLVGSVVTGAGNDAQAGRSRLYRNMNGERFEDVTEAAGIHFAGFGMGACWGDYDNDGDLDLYITAFGGNVLYENLGDGTFRDVTLLRGVQDSRFSSGCSWADYDRDGDLDLFVCNYVDFGFREGDRAVPDPEYAEQPYTLNPNAYAPVANSLFRNNGPGRAGSAPGFTDVAAQAGVDDPKGRGLSASWFDMDNDGWPDLYVANDVSYNGVFRNRADGTFEDIGASSLAADYRSAMGLAVADFDNELDLDRVITHWLAQENALYQNMTREERASGATSGRLWFMDVADAFGLGQISLDMVGWA
ncbi:MAG: VCBS repeat-containing protein, partial [Planctomycetota bacterium]